MESLPSVAILDDDIIICMIMEDAIRSDGMTSDCFQVPDKFFDFIRSRTPDCIILDMNIPDMTGIEVMCRLREMQIHAPVIMVTGDCDLPTATAAYRNGAADFITKPVDMQELITRIRAVLATVNQRPVGLS